MGDGQADGAEFAGTKGQLIGQSKQDGGGLLSADSTF